MSKRYIHTTKAWYWKTQEHAFNRDWVDEIMFYTDEPFGEMAMRWHDLQGQWAPRLEVFVESVNALALLSDLLSAIAQWSANDERMTPSVFRELLETCGFADRTPLKYEDSYPKQEVSSEPL